MLAMSWWGWAGVALLVVAGAMFASWRSYRKGVRREFVEYLRTHAPDLQVAAVHADRVELRLDGGATDGGTLYFLRLYQAVAALPAAESVDAAQTARQAIYAGVVKALRDTKPGLSALDGTDRESVMPRLMPDAAVSRLRRTVEESGQRLPVLPSGIAGLSIVFVLDREAAVAYLTETLLGELGLTPEQALHLARTNLARTFDREVVRQAVRGGTLNVVKCGDTFDAARLLLVPDCLEAGESLAAMVPDRDTLVLTSPPADGDWSGLRKLARTAAGDPLFAEPLVVTASGFARAA